MLVPGIIQILVISSVLQVTQSEKNSNICTSEKGVNSAPRWIDDLQSTLHFDGIWENTEVGTVIATLRACDPDGDVLRYFGEGGYFQVNEETGDVTLIRQLDREESSTFKTSFVAKDSKDNKVDIAYTVLVKDINDNTPAFLGIPYFAQVKENSIPGTLVYSGISAHDPDIGINSELSLYCDANESEESYEACEIFSVISRRTEENYLEGNIILKKTLDFEVKKKYVLPIVVTDNGIESRSSKEKIVIDVLDIQDNPPRFLNGGLHLVIKEDIEIGTSVGQLLASDTDLDSKRQLNISIRNDPHQYFTLDETLKDTDNRYSSVIRIKNEVDYEEAGRTYFFHVIVTEIDENGSASQSSQSIVTVEIEDVNDNCPMFDQALGYSVHVPESLPSGQAIPGLFIQVRDIDSEKFNHFNLSLGGKSAEAFSISPISGQGYAFITMSVVDSQVLDYEVDAYREHDLSIVATEDKVEKPCANMAVVKIIVDDVNDHDPVIQMGDTSNIKMSENLKPGSRISKIQALDADSGRNGELSYSLEGEHHESFEIDSKSGDLRLIGDVNFEDSPFIPLRLMVTDGGGRSSALVVNITVVDGNDGAPVIADRQYMTSVNEGSIDMDPVINIQADDLEDISYSIISGNTPDLAFRVHPISGKLTLFRSLSYEETPNNQGYFDLIIEATDNGEPPQSSTVPVKVYVIDINDNAPVFSQYLYSTSITEVTAPGTQVITVTATDGDVGQNAQISYLIYSGSMDKFVINSNSGQIQVATNADLDIDMYGTSYNLMVYAVDAGSPPKTGTAQVSITVTDVNTKSPEFSQDVYLGSLADGSEAGTTAVVVSATDLDSRANLQYSIKPNTYIAKNSQGNVIQAGQTTFPYQYSFQIDPSSGAITTKNAIASDIVREVDFTVEVRDVAAYIPVVQTATATVNILIQAGANQVQFVPPSTNLVMDESPQVPSTPITTLNARDLATNQPCNNYVEVPGTDSGDYFSVERYSGNIYLVKPVDYEVLRGEPLTFQVSAWLSGSATPSSFTTVTLQVRDVNDNTPTFLQDSYSFMVPENAMPGYVVGIVLATDADFNGQDNLQYSLSGDDASQFTIDLNQGIVQVALPLDADTKSIYNLQVRVTDSPTGTGSPRYYNVPMTITLTDVNDNAPVFEMGQYVFSLPNTAAIGTVVGQVVASDQDILYNKVTYTIVSGNSDDVWWINGNSGELITVNSIYLKASTQPYALLVGVKDNGSPSMSNVVTVNIYVTGTAVNVQGQPVITSPMDQATFNILENSPANTKITKIVAQIEDGGDISYGLIQTEGMSKFTLNSTTGDLYAAQPLDREVQDSYVLIVVAQSVNEPNKESTISITVAVDDVDDNQPGFSNCANVPQGVVRLKEKQPANTMVYTITACDPDLISSLPTYYYIVCGNDPQEVYNGYRPFAIDKNTGNITTTVALDMSNQQDYTLCVKATNDANFVPTTNTAEDYQGDNSVAMLNIRVVGETESIGVDPVFITNSSFVAAIVAEAPFHTPVIQIVGYTSTTNPTNYVYSISDIRFYDRKNVRGKTDIAGAFTIEKDTGIVYTNLVHFLDYYGGYFTMTVQTASLSGTVTSSLLVYILSRQQVVSLTFDSNPDTVSNAQSDLLNDLALELGTTITQNGIRYHRTIDGEVNTDRVDICFHMLKDGLVMSLPEVQSLFADHDSQVLDIYKKYNLADADIGMCAIIMATSNWDGYWWLWWLLIALAILIFIIALILIIGIYCCWSRYKRKMTTYKPYIILDTIDGSLPTQYEWQETTVKMR